VGHVGLGGWGGALGGGVLEEYRVYVHIYIHVGTRIKVGTNWEFLKSLSGLTVFNNSTGKMNQNSVCS
jgi:hypothetical protein